jgi:hypothetical protein
MVIITFADDEAGAGVQVALTHRSFREFLTAVAMARETFEAKQEEFGGEEEESTALSRYSLEALGVTAKVLLGGIAAHPIE